MGTVVLDQGRPVLSLYSKGWDGVPVERPWDEWVSGHSLKADVEERRHHDLPRTGAPTADFFDLATYGWRYAGAHASAVAERLHYRKSDRSAREWSRRRP